jgi:hypothetical protein
MSSADYFLTSYNEYMSSGLTGTMSFYDYRIMKINEKEQEKQRQIQESKNLVLKNKTDNDIHAIKCFLQIKLPGNVTGHLLKFLDLADMAQLFKSIMTLFISGARFTQKAKHIIEDPLREHLLVYFKTQYSHMNSALPAFFNLNFCYREYLFSDRNLLIDYLHIPLRARNKFLKFSRSKLEAELLSAIGERNARVYETKYLPHLKMMLEVDKTGINDEGGFTSYRYEVELGARVREQKKRVITAYYKLTKKSETTQQFIDRLNADDYNYPHILEKYKRELKKSFCLPLDYEPDKKTDEVKYVKRTTKFVPPEDMITKRERQEKQHQEYLEKMKLEKLERVRKERENEKKKKMLEKELNKGKKKR